MNPDEITATGAPALPDGLFYRDHTDLPYGFYRIEVRRHREYLGSALIAEATSYPDELHTNPADVAATATRAYERAQRAPQGPLQRG